MWKKVEGVPKDGRKVLLECCGTPEDPHDPVRKWVFEPSWKNGSSKSCGCLTKREATKRSESRGLSSTPVGTKFGRWEVLEVVRASDVHSEAKPTIKMAKVRCSGSEEVPHDPVERFVYVTNLKQGLSVSCGCARLVHGMAMKNGNRHPLYHIWNGIVSRCENESYSNYHNYGGRGISLSEDFRNPATFFEYISSLPEFEDREARSLQLDRIDNNRGYEKGNLRWVTAKENNSNKRTTHEVIDSYTGMRVLASDVAKAEGLYNRYYRLRVRSNMLPDEALNTALNSPNRFIYVKKEPHHV